MNKPHTFQHEAMQTTFTLRLLHADRQHAEAAATDAFALLDEIEQSLSRYIEGSDVWQINHLQAGESLFIRELCYDCLRASLDANELTLGLFDVTMGTRIEHRKQNREGLPPEPCGRLLIDPERPAVHCLEAGREIDLGGIGKGFALDRMEDRLLEWEIESALLSAGSSTQLAYGPEPWTVHLCGTHCSHTIELKNEALSASGTIFQGAHIVSPDQPFSEEESYLQQKTWVIHPTGTLADAWSTALLLIDENKIEALEGRPPIIFREADGLIRNLSQIHMINPTQ